MSLCEGGLAGRLFLFRGLEGFEQLLRDAPPIWKRAVKLCARLSESTLFAEAKFNYLCHETTTAMFCKKACKKRPKMSAMLCAWHRIEEHQVVEEGVRMTAFNSRAQCFLTDLSVVALDHALASSQYRL